ncbi:MAG: tripartite tricarboxylate transporter TctB family protein [Bauldia sp.]
MVANRQDIALGGIFILIGVLFGADVFRTELAIGTPFRMGPGFFPIVLSGILILFGVIILVRGIAARIEAPEKRPIPWRAILVLAPLPIFFGLTINGLGLLPPIFIVALAASFASPKTGIVYALLTALGITAFCALVFVYLADLPLRPFGPWFDFLRGGGA